MGLFCKLVLLILVLLAVLHNSSGGKKGFGGKSTPSKKPSDKPSQGTKTQPNYPRQPSHPGAGSNPGYPNQYPGRGGSNPGGYPNQNPGFYPVRTAGQPGGYPGGHPSIGGGYPNWNPNNKILSPRYGGSFGGGGFGMGGSPFSQTVRGMGYGPSVQSKGFAKKAMLAAGVGAMAGTAVGYGIGNFPRPNFQFRSPQEERHYNNYMYQHHGTHSKGGNNKRGPSYTSKLPPQAQSYDQFMNICMKQSDVLKEQNMKDSAVRNNIQRDEPLTDYLSMNEDYLEKGELEKNDTASPTTVIDYPKNAGIHNDEDDDTVSIIEIGYPALIEQMKTRKCVEQYLVYSESFPEKQKEKNFGNGHSVSGVLLFLTTSFMLFRGT